MYESFLFLNPAETSARLLFGPSGICTLDPQQDKRSYDLHPAGGRTRHGVTDTDPGKQCSVAEQPAVQSSLWTDFLHNTGIIYFLHGHDDALFLLPVGLFDPCLFPVLKT